MQASTLEQPAQASHPESMEQALTWRQNDTFAGDSEKDVTGTASAGDNPAGLQVGDTSDLLCAKITGSTSVASLCGHSSRGPSGLVHLA